MPEPRTYKELARVIHMALNDTEAVQGGRQIFR
jgi:hypothetical protein